MGGDDRRAGSRHAVGLLVKLKHANVGTFVQRFATNISPGGMFIRTRQPKPAGTLVRFEVQIAGGERVMRGEAVVRWKREASDPSGSPGMGLEFLQLDAATRAIIDRMLEAREAPEEAKAPAAETKPPPAKAKAAPPPKAAPKGPTVEVPVDRFGVPDEKPPPKTAPKTAPKTEPPPPKPAPKAKAAPPPPPPEALEPPPSRPPGPSVDIPTEDLLRDTPPYGTPAPDLAPPEETPEPDDDLELDVDVSSGDDEDLEVDVQTTRQLVFIQPPAEIPTTGPIIGIDLGTTNSCIGCFEEGRPKVVFSREGYNTLPSIVALSPKGKLLVGHPAKSQMLTNPERTVYGAKRLVGRAFDSPTVRMVRDRFHYDVCADDTGRAAVRLGDDVVSLEEVQGLVLREAKALAEIHLEKPVSRAVVTVPAYYSDAQRHAVRDAGRLAGLNVERILNEPTAAALAYGLNRDFTKKVLIYDLGGGTFDATAMLIDGNVFEVLATGGDTFLGGVDFDAQVVDWLLTRFEETTGKAFAGDRVALSRVNDAAERAKIALSERVRYDVQVPFLMLDEDGVPHDLNTTITREDLESLTEGMVERTLDVVRDVLLDANLKPSDVEEVILVGGQSRMPLVRAKLGAFFGRDAHPGVHPDEAVALGAALLAGSLDKVTSMVLIDVLPMTIGVGLPGGRFKRVVERNTPLPASKTYGLATTRDDQTFIEISIFQGEADNVAGNEYLGTLRLDGLPKRARGEVKIAVTFELGQECVLEVEARELATGGAVNATLATRDTPDEIRRRLHVTVDAEQAAETARQAELEARGGRFWRFLKRVVGASGE